VQRTTNLSDSVCAFCRNGDFAQREVSDGQYATLNGLVIERIRVVEGVECDHAELRVKTLNDMRGEFMPFESYCPYWQALRDGDD